SLLTLTLLREKRSEIIRIAGELGGKNVRVFGSVARGEDGGESDIDLLINMQGTDGLREIHGPGRAREIERFKIRVAVMTGEIKTLLGHEVHVVVLEWLPPRQRKRIMQDAVPL